MIATGNPLIELKLNDDIVVSATDCAEAPLLEVFFEGYNRAFVLPDEREELSGFRECLALNNIHRPDFGHYHSELVAVFRDVQGTLLGGANFLATAMTPRPGWPPATIALNYVYVESAARGRGLLRLILSAVQRLAMTALRLDPDGKQAFIFLEQNDPLRLSAKEYQADTTHSGTDQVDRLTIWARMGTRIVDFPYVQPALSSGQRPDDGLLLGAICPEGQSIEAALLYDHLKSFFAISVLKGRRAGADCASKPQLAELSKREGRIALLSMEPAICWMKSGRKVDQFKSFRELAVVASISE